MTGARCLPARGSESAGGVPAQEEVIPLRIAWRHSPALWGVLAVVGIAAAWAADDASPEGRWAFGMAALVPSLQAVLLAVLRAWPRDQVPRLNAVGMQWRRGARVEAAAWREIASIEAHATRHRNDFAGVEIKPHAPSGHGMVWLNIWDIHALPRADIAARLTAWHLRCGAGPAGASAAHGARVSARQVSSTVSVLGILVVAAHVLLAAVFVHWLFFRGG